MILPVPIFGQRDARWASQRLGTVAGATLGSEGCLITDIAMMSSYYNHPIFPGDLNSFLTSNGLYYDGDLFIWGSITKLFADIKFDKGVFCQTSPAPIDDIKNYLDQGKPVVVSLLNYGITHFVLVVGYDGDKIYANDPWQGDQVAINDRWGDPKLKILQVNYFSGPIPATSQVPTPPVVVAPVVPVQPPITVSQPPVDAGGDEAGMVISQPIPPIPASTNVDLSSDHNQISPLQPPLVQQPPVVDTQSTTPSFLDSLKSRKFILSVAASLVGFLNTRLNLGFTEVQVWMIILPLMAYVITEGLADIVERARKTG